MSFSAFRAAFTACLILAGSPATSPAYGESLDFAMGKALFDRPWVAAPALTQADDGLGPMFVARSCAACHPAAGRGAPPPGLGTVLRFADDPVYGRQLQPSAVPGQPSEGRLEVREEFQTVRYPDGAVVELRRLIPSVADPGFGPPPAVASLRVAPPLHGLGLLEQAGARFGWKADQPDLRRQVAAAFHLDVGMSTPVYPQHWGDCTETQTACRAGPHGDSAAFDGLEISGKMLDLVAVYLKRLPPPPAPRPDAAGARLFAQTGCAACHTPATTLDDGRKVAAFSDMKLHDMGPGLADGVPGVADPAGPLVAAPARPEQWRTPPLWGLRDAEPDDAGRLALLHDGRARSVEEAVLWHGGDAEDAKKRFTALSAAQRAALLRYVGSL